MAVARRLTVKTVFLKRRTSIIGSGWPSSQRTKRRKAKAPVTRKNKMYREVQPLSGPSLRA